MPAAKKRSHGRRALSPAKVPRTTKQDVATARASRDNPGHKSTDQVGATPRASRARAAVCHSEPLAPAPALPASDAGPELVPELEPEEGPEPEELSEDGIVLRPTLAAVSRQLAALLMNTVENGQNFSMLLMGPQGVGKTLALEHAIKLVERKVNSVPDNPTLLVVRLDGVLHGDDRLAFTEVARQLCRSIGSSFSKTATFDDNLSFLRLSLAELHRALKTVVFVVEELEAYTRRSKQLVLYNLLDALQQPNMQAAVIGVTCSQDVKDSMEKRVRSRFSHRKIVVTAPTLDDKVGDHAKDVLASMLLLRATPGCDAAEAEDVQTHNAAVVAAMHHPEVQEHLRAFVRDVGAVPRALREVAQRAAEHAESSEHSDGLTHTDVLNALRDCRAAADTAVLWVCALSVLELALLVAVLRLERRGQEHVTFQVLFEELRHACQEEKLRGGALAWERPTALRAFQVLCSMALMRTPDARGQSRGRQLSYCNAELLISPDDIERGVKLHSTCPVWLLRWMTNTRVN